MSEYKIPSSAELWEAYCEEDERYEQVYEHADPSWRHGCYMTTVLKDFTGRFWMIDWQKSGDGETNTWREGYADVSECWPVVVTKTEYSSTKPE